MAGVRSVYAAHLAKEVVELLNEALNMSNMACNDMTIATVIQISGIEVGWFEVFPNTTPNFGRVSI